MADHVDINKIYSEYFRIVDSYFGSIKHYLSDDEDGHIILGEQISGYPLISDLILDATEDLGKDIDLFWQKNARDIFDYLKKQDSLRCLYSGDITPVILESFVKKTALYVDTIILPDPILNLHYFARDAVLDKKFYLSKLIRHVFNVWRLSELVLAKAELPVLLILPINLSFLAERDNLLVAAEEELSKYMSDIFGIDVHSREECMEFLSEIQTGEDILSKAVNTQILPFKFQDKKFLNDYLSSMEKGFEQTSMPKFKLGERFGMYLYGQFVRVQEHKYFCKKLVAEPIYDYEIPWHFFNHNVGGGGIDGGIINALQKERFEWIGRVPLNALKVLREENKLDYMRSVMRSGITDLRVQRDQNLLKVAEQLENNFSDAFDKQKAELEKIQKQVNKIVAKEMPITIGGFLAGFVQGLNVVVSVASAGRDIRKNWLERKKLQNKASEKQKECINLLMKCYEE